MTAALQENDNMTDVTISHDDIRDIFLNRMGLEQIDVESFIKCAEETRDEKLHHLVRQYSRCGYRGPELYERVRFQFPTATLDECKTAAVKTGAWG